MRTRLVCGLLVLAGACGGEPADDGHPRSDRAAGGERSEPASPTASRTPRRIHPPGCADAVAFDNGDLVAGERTRLLRFHVEAGETIRAMARFDPPAEITLALRGPSEGRSTSTVVHLPRVSVMGESPGTGHDELRMTTRESGHYELEAELADGVVRWHACVFVDWTPRAPRLGLAASAGGRAPPRAHAVAVT